MHVNEAVIVIRLHSLPAFRALKRILLAEIIILGTIVAEKGDERENQAKSRDDGQADAFALVHDLNIWLLEFVVILSEVVLNLLCEASFGKFRTRFALFVELYVLYRWWLLVH